MSLESMFKLSLFMNMVDNLSGPMGKISRQTEDTMGRFDQMGQKMGKLAKTGAAISAAGAGIVAGVLAPIEATFETRRAIGELASLGVKDLTAVERAATDFSNTWSGTVKPEFVTAAYDIKSGIASLSDIGVAQYTQMASLTAKATKSTAGEMTSLFATGYGIYKDYYSSLSDLEFGEMFSAGIAKSVQQFKTTGAGMAQAIQSLGASATTANIPFEEQLSILGMLQATMGGGEAGTKYKAFLRSAVRGGEELGLSFMDANDQLLSLPEILDKLQGKFGQTMDAAEKMELQKAFGDAEAVALIDLLYSKTGDLQDNILGLNSSLGSGMTVATQMATAMNQMEPDQWQLLQQNLRNVNEILGSTLLPTVNKFIGKGIEAAQIFGSWAQNNQSLVRVVMLLVLAFGAFLAVAGSVIAAVGSVGLIFSKLIGGGVAFITFLGIIPDKFTTLRLYGMFAADGIRKGFTIMRTAAVGAIGGIKSVAVSIATMAKTAVVSGFTALKSMTLGMIGMAKQALITAVTAMPGLIASVWGFTAALLANPITWVVVAIMALIAAVILLWQNWDQVTAFLSGAWNGFCAGFTAAVDGIKAVFSNFIGWIQEKLAWFGQIGASIMDKITGGINAGGDKPAGALGGALQKVRNLLPFSDAKEGPLSTLTLSGRRMMTTLSGGMEAEATTPADTLARGLGSTRGILERAIKPIQLDVVSQAKSKPAPSERDADKGIIIQKLYISPDISKIKDLPSLLKLVEELVDANNASSGDKEPLPQPV